MAKVNKNAPEKHERSINEKKAKNVKWRSELVVSIVCSCYHELPELLLCYKTLTKKKHKTRPCRSPPSQPAHRAPSIASSCLSRCIHADGYLKVVMKHARVLMMMML